MCVCVCVCLTYSISLVSLQTYKRQFDHCNRKNFFFLFINTTFLSTT